MSDAVTVALIGFASAAFGASVGALATLRAADRRMVAEKIIDERQKWREKIRQLANDVVDDNTQVKRRQLVTALAINTNPYNPDDRELVDYLRSRVEGGLIKRKTDIFADHIALLLKHDWNRAKTEVRSGIFTWILGEPKRVSYKRWERARGQMDDAKGS